MQLSSLDEASVDVKLAAPDGAARITFEPLGDVIELASGEHIFVRVPLAGLSSLEIYMWPNGISVWLPYPGDYAILNPEKSEIGRV